MDGRQGFADFLHVYQIYARKLVTLWAVMHAVINSDMRRVTVLSHIGVYIVDNLQRVEPEWHFFCRTLLNGRCWMARTELTEAVVGCTLVVNYLLLYELIHCAFVFAIFVYDGLDHTIKVPVEVCQLLKPVSIGH